MHRETSRHTQAQHLGTHVPHDIIHLEHARRRYSDCGSDMCQRDYFVSHGDDVNDQWVE